MGQRRQRTQNSPVSNENIKLPITLENHCAKSVKGVMIRQVTGYQRRLAPRFLNFVVEFLQGALSAGKRDDMDALARKRQREGAAYAARSSGDECDAL
jgi:hypothetical protein